jgi:hypothetical protein
MIQPGSPDAGFQPVEAGPMENSMAGPWPAYLVRREKGALLQWEEGIPPGNYRSSRKQPERSKLATALGEASGGKGR